MCMEIVSNIFYGFSYVYIYLLIPKRCPRRIAIFSSAAESHKKQWYEIKSDFNSKMSNFDMGIPVTEHIKKV